MRRPCEDSSSADSGQEEDIDVGSEDICPRLTRLRTSSCTPPMTTTTQVMARKRRRGMIEKRRRDRINSSLSELRTLVPTAYEKQGSAKLEKAEILQMTVDHLKMLQATGGKGYFDVHALALDFLSLGFRECVMEASRYLTVVEGLDSSDPLSSRLLSHLAACASQRDAAAAATLTAASHCPHHHHHAPPPQQWAAAAYRQLPAAAAPLRLNGLPVSLDAGAGGAPQGLADLLQHSATSSYSSHTDSTSSSSSSSSLLLPCSPAPLLSLSASFPIILPGGFPVPAPSSSQTPPSSVRPYRPWGTDVGVF